MQIKQIKEVLTKATLTEKREEIMSHWSWDNMIYVIEEGK